MRIISPSGPPSESPSFSRRRNRIVQRIFVGCDVVHNTAVPDIGQESWIGVLLPKANNENLDEGEMCVIT